MRFGENSVVQSAVVALDTGADVLVFTPGVPCRIVRYGVIVSVLLDADATPLILALDTNDLLASPVRTERWTLTTPVANHVIGTVFSRAPQEDSSDDFTMVAGLDKNVIVPGMQAILQVTGTGAVAGDGHVFIEYTPLSWQTAFQVGTANVHSPNEVTV